ncbi:MAG: hypothetical protein JWM78_3374 [Verrucomicrobiaceae bacterium]|nr:hypothetical protein [Verrucomicrobiaceae bacterium]
MSVIGGIGYSTAIQVAGGAAVGAAKIATASAKAAWAPFANLISGQAATTSSQSTAVSPSLLAKAALAVTPSSSGSKSSAANEFQKYMEMTPAEKIRYNTLSQMGLTEDDLKALPPEQQEKIENTIAERIKDQAQSTALAKSNAAGQPQTSGAVALFNAIQGSNTNNHSLDIYS